MLKDYTIIAISNLAVIQVVNEQSRKDLRL